jgi:hypothetical protein
MSAELVPDAVKLSGIPVDASDRLSIRDGRRPLSVHLVGHNPTYALERDLQLIQWLDLLGFDEAWVGEHHSGCERTSPFFVC